MAETGLKIDTRRKKILELLMRDGQVRASQLSAQFGTTVVTIRNDLAALEADGYLQRVSGGAVQTVKNLYNMDFLTRRQQNAEHKKTIAKATAALVNDGETLLINSGVTTYYTASALKVRKNLNVVTNSLSVAMELGTQPTFRVILLGGDINAQYSYTHGTDALEQLRHYKADLAILSIDGISAVTGLTTYHAEESAIDRAMMERARRTIIPADYTKLGHESFSFVHDAGKADVLVTNECADPEVLHGIGALGVKTVLC